MASPHHITEITTNESVMAWLLSLCSGVILQITEPQFLHWDFPPIFLHTLQIIVWSVNIIVGCITIYKWLKKKHKQ